jgi:hypothetical protein
MVGKALAILGFIRKLSFEVRDPYTLKSLYVFGSSEIGVRQLCMEPIL